MSADPPAPHLFVSYASADRARVVPIVAALEGAGVRVWVDRAGITGGASYGPEIVTAIRVSRALLLLCSAAAFASRNVRQEVALAWKHVRPILPLLLEPSPIPDELAYWLEAAQWIEVLDRPEGDWLPEVVRALNRLGVRGESVPVPEPVARAAEVHLPTPLTGLVGRERELTEVVALLASHRLVTLTGPGGWARPGWRSRRRGRPHRCSRMASTSLTCPLSGTPTWCCRRSPRRWACAST